MRTKIVVRNPPCEDCGRTKNYSPYQNEPFDCCPNCKKVVCMVCAEREGSFCCDENQVEAFDLKALTNS